MKESKLPTEIRRHYEAGAENGRLDSGGGYLEWIRTQEIIKRFLPRHSLNILDIGGGPGAYSSWLAGLGHNVSLIDPVPSHIVRARARAQGGSKESFDAKVGDARHLDLPSGCMDAVLMLGPLYHLTRRRDRIQSLREARRVLRPKGMLFAAAISRYASLIDGLKYRFIDDPVFRGILRRDLKRGQHRNPTAVKGYFTTSFFHHPTELQKEVEEASFMLEGIYAIEGPAELLYDDKLDEMLRDDETKSHVLRFLTEVETEPSLLGVSSHLLAVAMK